MIKSLFVLTILLYVGVAVGFSNNSLTIQCASHNLESVRYEVRKGSTGVCVLNLYVVDGNNKLLNKHDLCINNICIYSYNTTIINDCMLSIECDQQLNFYYKFNEYPRPMINGGVIGGIVIISAFWVVVAIVLIVFIRCR